MMIDPINPEIRQALREIHLWISGYVEGRQDDRWEGLDPSHLDALDCVLQYLDEKADRNGEDSHDI